MTAFRCRIALLIGEAGLIELGTMDQAPDIDQELINFDRL